MPETPLSECYGFLIGNVVAEHRNALAIQQLGDRIQVFHDRPPALSTYIVNALQAHTLSRLI
jgi:hypothetical protein